MHPIVVLMYDYRLKKHPLSHQVQSTITKVTWWQDSPYPWDFCISETDWTGKLWSNHPILERRSAILLLLLLLLLQFLKFFGFLGCFMDFLGFFLNFLNFFWVFLDFFWRLGLFFWIVGFLLPLFWMFLGFFLVFWDSFQSYLKLLKGYY